MVETFGTYSLVCLRYAALCMRLITPMNSKIVIMFLMIFNLTGPYERDIASTMFRKPWVLGRYLIDMYP